MIHHRLVVTVCALTTLFPLLASASVSDATELRTQVEAEVATFTELSDMMETDNPEAEPSRKAVAARARSAEFHQDAVRLLQEGEHGDAQIALESAWKAQGAAIKDFGKRATPVEISQATQAALRVIDEQLRALGTSETLATSGAAARVEHAKSNAEAARALMLKGAQQEALERAINGLRAL